MSTRGYLAHRNDEGVKISQKSATLNPKPPVACVLRDLRRATRRHYSAEDKIRIVLEGLRGEYSISALCRREGIAESLYYAMMDQLPMAA